MAQPSVLEEFLIKLSVQGPDSGQLREAEKGFEALRLGIESLLPGLAAAAAGTVAVIKTFADSLTETFYAAQKLGSTTEHVTALGDAAERAGGSVEGVRADLDALVAKMRGSPAFKDWLKTNLHLSAGDMATSESILVASSKALAAMRQMDPQHYKGMRDYIGTSEATILAVARPEFDAAYKQQKEFTKGLDGIVLKSVELHNDWIATTAHFKEALELISGPFMTAMDAAIKRADAWLTEKKPAIEAFANSTARTVADIISKLGAIPFGRIADQLFDGLQKGLAKINFDTVKTVFNEFMNWLVTGPLVNAIIALVSRIGAASGGFFDAIMPGMGPVQAPGAPGSQGRFSHGSSNVGRAMNQEGAPVVVGASGAPHPGYYGGTIELEGEQFHYGTGVPSPHGANRGSSAYGDHPLEGGFDPSARGGKGGFRVQDQTDPNVPGGTRRGVEIHEGRSDQLDHLYTAGCFAVAASEWPRFKAKLQGYLKANPGAVLRIGEGGRAQILPKGTPSTQKPAGPPGPLSDLQLPHAMHTKLAALVSHPGFRQNIAMLTNHQPRTSMSRWSRHDGTRNQNVNIEITSTDPHSAASEIARQMAGLQGRTMRDWKVA